MMAVTLKFPIIAAAGGKIALLGVATTLASDLLIADRAIDGPVRTLYVPCNTILSSTVSFTVVVAGVSAVFVQTRIYYSIGIHTHTHIHILSRNNGNVPATVVSCSGTRTITFRPIYEDQQNSPNYFELKTRSSRAQHNQTNHSTINNTSSSTPTQMM